MAWVNAATVLSTADQQNDRKRFSQLIVNTDKIHFAYERHNTGDLTNPTKDNRIYYRNWNNSALSTAVAVSDSSSLYYCTPGIGVWDNETLFVSYELGENKVNTGSARAHVSTDNGATWLSNSLYGHGQFVWVGVYASGSDKAYVFARGPISGIYAIWTYGYTGNNMYSFGNLIQLGTGDAGGALQIFGMYNAPPQSTIQRGPTVCMVGPRDRGEGYKTITSIVGVSNSGAGVERTIFTSTVAAPRTPLLCEGSDNVLRMVFTNLKADGVTPTLDLAMSYDFGQSWTFLARPAAFDATDSFGTVVKWPPLTLRGEVGFCLDRTNQWWVTVPHYDTAGVIKNRLHTYKGSADGLTWSLFSSEAITDGGTKALDASPSSTVQSGPHSSVVWGNDLYRIISAKDTATGWVEMWLMKNANVASTGRGPTGGSSTAYRFPD
jgi:hypothetical protein